MVFVHPTGFHLLWVCFLYQVVEQVSRFLRWYIFRFGSWVAYGSSKIFGIFQTFSGFFHKNYQHISDHILDMYYDIWSSKEYSKQSLCIERNICIVASLRFHLDPFEALLKDRSTDVRQASWMDGWWRKPGRAVAQCLGWYSWGAKNPVL